jgi:hypothetical protein
LAAGDAEGVVAIRHDQSSSEPIAQIFENIFNIRGDLDEGRVERHWPFGTAATASALRI